MWPQAKVVRFSVIISVIFLVSLSFVLLGQALTPPPPVPLSSDSGNWLNRKGISSPAVAQAYYETINAPTTLDEWLNLYGFASDEVHAVYYNAADLGFGRDMHCREGSDFIACIVGNYGLGPAGPAHIALNNATAQQDILASVAMVYEKRGGLPDAAPGNLDNRVKFYIYDAQGQLIPAVPLDREGEKYLPQMCLPCHGGFATVLPDANNPVTVTVDAANFLPFDPFSFEFSEKEGFTQAEQEEAFRALNALVYDTTPTASITELIEGLYPGGVGNPGSAADENFVPLDWSDTLTNTETYQNVVAVYCRTCHVAQVNVPPAPALFGAAEFPTFESFQMPHAELTFNDFWRYGDPGTPAFFAQQNGWSTVVGSTVDTVGTCPGSNCSLRSAINLANMAAGENIITFDPATNGNPITLSLPGAGANGGDLDVTRPDKRILILGNGADVTIIDGATLDRVFHIAPGATVYLQALTIQGGLTSSSGGGIYNQGNLTLNDVIITENEADSGGGIANAGEMSLDDSAVFGNTAVTGAGIANTSVFTLSTTTLSTNNGSGLYNSGTMTMNYSTVTENGAGGVLNDSGTVTIGTSALANNNGSADCSGTIVSAGYNLVQNSTGCTLTGETATNVVGVPALLGPLETPDGGSTPSHLPLPGSPLLDAVPFETDPFAFVSIVDQHGTRRPQLVQNDIGAMERLTIETLFLPVLLNNYVFAPDLVITSLTATEDLFAVVIENQGNAPTANAFWVDLYIDPDPAPTAVNQIWPDLSDEGLVWGVTDSLAAGEVLTLTYTPNPADTHPYFFESESNYSGSLPLGTTVYAQVDSANANTTTGAVLESHEIMGSASNNIIGSSATFVHTTQSTLGGSAPKVDNKETFLLPPR